MTAVVFDPYHTSSKDTLSNGSRTVERTPFYGPASGHGSSLTAALPKNTGKWYYEFIVASGSSSYQPGWWVGLCDPAFAYENNSVGFDDGGGFNSYAVSFVAGYGFRSSSFVDGGGGAFSFGDVIGIAYDADARVVKVYRNNSLVITSAAISAGSYVPAVSPDTTSLAVGTGYFTAADFTYSPPAGYSAWGGAVETGTGALAADAATVAATGTDQSAGTGALLADAASVAGSGTDESTGTGALLADAATLAGAGADQYIAAGALLASAAIVAGAGTDESTGTGALLADAAALVGAGTDESTGTGTLVDSASTMAGAGAALAGPMALSTEYVVLPVDDIFIIDEFTPVLRRMDLDVYVQTADNDIYIRLVA